MVEDHQQLQENDFSSSECFTAEARAVAATENDFFRLLAAAEKYADKVEYEAAEILLTKALQLAVFSADMVDIMRLIRQHQYLQKRFPLGKCLLKARMRAILKGDFIQIDQFVYETERMAQYGY